MLTKTLLVWVPALLVATVAVVEGGMHTGAHAARKAPEASCKGRELAVDLDGDGRIETVKLVRVGDEAWVDVWSGPSLRSSTRVGAWRDDAGIEALDVDGDGKIDLVRRWSDAGAERAQVWLSDGLAFQEGGSSVTRRACIAQR